MFKNTFSTSNPAQSMRLIETRGVSTLTTSGGAQKPPAIELGQTQIGDELEFPLLGGKRGRSRPEETPQGNPQEGKRPRLSNRAQTTPGTEEITHSAFLLEMELAADRNAAFKNKSQAEVQKYFCLSNELTRQLEKIAWELESQDEDFEVRETLRKGAQTTPDEEEKSAHHKATYEAWVWRLGPEKSVHRRKVLQSWLSSRNPSVEKIARDFEKRSSQTHLQELHKLHANKMYRAERLTQDVLKLNQDQFNNFVRLCSQAETEQKVLFSAEDEASDTEEVEEVEQPHREKSEMIDLTADNNEDWATPEWEEPQKSNEEHQRFIEVARAALKYEYGIDSSDDDSSDDEQEPFQPTPMEDESDFSDEEGGFSFYFNAETGKFDFSDE